MCLYCYQPLEEGCLHFVLIPKMHHITINLMVFYPSVLTKEIQSKPKLSTSPPRYEQKMNSVVSLLLRLLLSVQKLFIGNYNRDYSPLHSEDLPTH